MPRLWNETIDAHRREVRDAILDTTASLVFKHGLRAVTMAQVAEQTGIGRATLYKYFPDIDAILHAWHAREITAHLELLARARDGADDPSGMLEAVLRAYALVRREMRTRHDTELVAFLHRDDHVANAQAQLHDMVRRIVAEGARTGDFRDDIAPGELAHYCLSALTAAPALPSKAAVQRLVTIILDGLRPRH